MKEKPETNDPGQEALVHQMLGEGKSLATIARELSLPYHQTWRRYRHAAEETASARPPKRTVSVRVPAVLHARIMAAASKARLPATELVTAALATAFGGDA